VLKKETGAKIRALLYQCQGGIKSPSLISKNNINIAAKVKQLYGE
jgi:hypothetical protein